MDIRRRNGGEKADELSKQHVGAVWRGHDMATAKHQEARWDGGGGERGSGSNYSILLKCHRESWPYLDQAGPLILLMK